MKIKLNISNWVNASDSLAQGYAFENIVSITPEPSTPYERLTISYDQEDHYWYASTYDDHNVLIATYSGSNMITGLGSEVTLDCELGGASRSNIIRLIDANLVNIDIEGLTSIILYRQNSENNVVSKNLTYVDIFQGKFNSAIGLKDLEIDVTNFVIGTNYAYIPTFKRYYYIESITLVSADLTRLFLREDVLMSWASLIRSQSAYITRWAGSTNKNYLVDNRRPVEDKITTEKVSVTDTPVANSFVNVTLDYSNDGMTKYPNILVTTMSTEVERLMTGKAVPPTGAGLPDITTDLNNFEWCNCISTDELFYLILAYLSSSANASFIESVIMLPFDPTTAFGLTTQSYYAIYVKDKYIDHLGRYQSATSSEPPLKCWRMDTSKEGVCPYLIIKDFTLTASNNFYDREPYANYELYVPFVGYVKIETSKLFGKRILVYYTMDFKTGISTAYVYNYTDQYVIWSGNCQLGIKIDMATSNKEENIKQKQANDLNMLIGTVSSALSIGVGAVTSNPVALAGGVLSFGKTLASYANANNQIFERASMSFGTSNGALHAPSECALVKLYHKPISITTATYERLEGYPYNSYASLSSLTGYVEVGDIQFKPSLNRIYQVEIAEIVALLKNGVIL